MALAFQRDEISVECIGREVIVPNNDVAKLMYYLSCVCTVIDCNDDPEIRRFTNYRNWSSLTTGEQAQLLVVCYTFSPDVFDDKVFFHSDVLCDDSENEFYRINQVRDRLIAADSIIIAGRSREVNKIMTYKLSWMQKYYLEPMQSLVRRLDNASRPATTYGSVSRPPAARPYTPSRTPYVYQQDLSTTRSKPCCTSCRCLCILCSILIGVPVIVAIVYVIIAAVK